MESGEPASIEILSDPDDASPAKAPSENEFRTKCGTIDGPLRNYARIGALGYTPFALH